MEWILCPECRGKTRTQIREDTVMEKFPPVLPEMQKDVSDFGAKLRNRMDRADGKARR